MSDATASPIRGLQAKNLRTFEDTEFLQFSVLNFVFGKNSSGKTTLVRSPLILRQLVQSGKSIRGDVSFSGHQVDFGSYADVVHGGKTNLDIELKYEIDISEEISSYGFTRRNAANPLRHLEKIQLILTFHWNQPYRRTQYQNITILDADGDLFFDATRKGPGRTYVDFPAVQMSGNISHAHAELGLDTLRGMIFAATRKRRNTNTEQILLPIVLDSISSALNRIHHVGPLRDEPERTYRTDQLDAESDSNKGALRGLSANPRAVKLVGRSLEQLGIAAEIEVTNPAPNYAGIVLRDPVSGRMNNLADVGFGVSQVLPIITRLATAGEDEQILIEQPELHLHPETQGALVDVMFGLAKSRSLSLLVESHSENMLLRLRRRVAEGIIDPEDVRIFVTNEGRVNRAAIDENGDVDMDAFPRDFFEEDWFDTLQIAKAAAKKSRRR